MAKTPEEIKQEGKTVFLAGGAAKDCPYTFDRSPFWDRKDYTGFNAVRWKLDAWMAGWIEAQRNSRSDGKATAS
jgi:hypothetical protein